MDRDRRLAFLILKDMEQKDSYSNLVINSYLKDGDASSPAFVRELVYGVLRNQFLLDSNIACYLKKPGLKAGERVLLRMGFYQLALMDGVPSYAAVGETVKLAASFMKGRQGFINGVLRSFERDGASLSFPDEKDGETHYLSVRYSCHEDIVRLWLSSYGREKTEEMLAASLKPAPLAVRVNTLKISADGLKRRLASEGIEARDCDIENALILEGSGALDTPEFRDGLFIVQDQASQLAAATLGPKPGDFVVDLCAAPGGKTCTMAMIMENRGEIRAFDYYESRAALVAKNAARLGITIVSASAADACVNDPSLEGRADCVLCDVPCSGLGVIGRKPEIKLRSPQKKDEKLPEKQLLILHNGAACVMLKGKLLYSTCTVSPEENSELVRRFLEENPDFVIEEEKQLFPSEHSDGFYICLLRRQNDKCRIQNR